MLRVCKEKGLCFWISMQYVCVFLMGGWLLERSVKNDVTQTHVGKGYKESQTQTPLQLLMADFFVISFFSVCFTKQKIFKRKKYNDENYHFLCLEGTLSRCVLLQLIQHSQTVHLYKGEEGLINRGNSQGRSCVSGPRKGYCKDDGDADINIPKDVGGIVFSDSNVLNTTHRKLYDHRCYHSHYNLITNFSLALSCASRCCCWTWHQTRKQTLIDYQDKTLHRRSSHPTENTCLTSRVHILAKSLIIFSFHAFSPSLEFRTVLEELLNRPVCFYSLIKRREAMKAMP